MKMNEAFSEYIRSSTFRIELSKQQIIALGRVYGACGMSYQNAAALPLATDAFFALQRKGLLRHCSYDEWGLTHEGCFMVALLQSADMLRRPNQTQVDPLGLAA